VCLPIFEGPCLRRRLCGLQGTSGGVHSVEMGFGPGLDHGPVFIRDNGEDPGLVVDPAEFLVSICREVEAVLAVSAPRGQGDVHGSLSTRRARRSVSQFRQAVYSVGTFFGLVEVLFPDFPAQSGCRGTLNNTQLWDELNVAAT
jgi:hypothetical protein